MKCILLLVLAAVYIQSCAADCVQTEEGIISGGELTTRKGRKIKAFRGIPYAESPTGPRRFRDPVPKAPWKGSYKAHTEGPQCIQKLAGVIHGSEDCLYVNVFTPEIKPEKPMPVMLQISGGHFIMGNSSLETTSPAYLLDKDVVLVTCNYRVGIFGFLSTGDEASPGNFGIKDAILVLQWVHANIAVFGGNPDEVTVFGEDAGGAIVHLLTLIDKAKPLFKRAIVQSDGSLTLPSFTSQPSYYEKPKQVAELFKCPTTDSAAIVDCLRRVDPNDLLNISVFDKWAEAFIILWRPAKEPASENAVLTETPEELIRHGKMKDCPIITGNVNSEASYIVRTIAAKEELYQECVNNPVGVIERILQYYDPIRKVNVADLANKVKNFYFGKKLPNDKNIVMSKYEIFLSDFLFFFPQQQFLDYMQKVQAELFYSYRFKYRGDISQAIPLEGIISKCSSAHEDDQFYLFPLSSEVIGPEYHIKPSQKDYEIVDIVVDLWTSFARDSVPTSSRLDNTNQWKPHKSKTYLQIGSGASNTTTLSLPLSPYRNMQFWYDNAPLYNLGCS